MSTRRLAFAVAFVLCLVPSALFADPVADVPAALNPDVGDAQLAVDLFVIRSTDEISMDSGGVALMMGVSTRITAMVQFASEKVPWSTNDRGLVFEGRMRFYLGSKGHHGAKGPRQNLPATDDRSPR